VGVSVGRCTEATVFSFFFLGGRASNACLCTGRSSLFGGKFTGGLGDFSDDGELGDDVGAGWVRCDGRGGRAFESHECGLKIRLREVGFVIEAEGVKEGSVEHFLSVCLVGAYVWVFIYGGIHE
jgi:hypothetical protein